MGVEMVRKICQKWRMRVREGFQMRRICLFWILSNLDKPEFCCPNEGGRKLGKFPNIEGDVASFQCWWWMVRGVPTDKDCEGNGGPA